MALLTFNPMNCTWESNRYEVSDERFNEAIQKELEKYAHLEPISQGNSWSQAARYHVAMLKVGTPSYWGFDEPLDEEIEEWDEDEDDEEDDEDDLDEDEEE